MNQDKTELFLNFLETNGKGKSSELARAFDISRSTATRELRRLHSLDLIKEGVEKGHTVWYYKHPQNNNVTSDKDQFNLSEQLSVKNRILLHLLRYNAPISDNEVPLEITQKGIAEEIKANKSYISIPINKFLRDEKIKVSTGHINHGKRKHNYYLLTDKGKEHIKKIKSDISTINVTFKESDDIIKTMPIKEIVNYIKTQDEYAHISELDIYNTISKEGLFDTDYFRPIQKNITVDFSDTIPEITHFYGRKKELVFLKKWIEDNESHNIILINGMAGIGKTTLASKLIEDYRESYHIFWHDFNDLDTIRGVLLKLADFLSQLRDEHLEMYLRTRTSLDFYEITRILEKSIRKLNAIIIFDDFQKSNDQIRKFFVYLIKILSRPSQTKMLILSREIIPFYGRIDLKRNIVTELNLEGLDFESCKRFFKEKGLDQTKFKTIFEFTAGNPLFIEVIETRNDLNRFMHEELFSNLNNDEKNILEIFSVYRFPIYEENFTIFYDINLEKLYNMNQKSLIKKDSQNRFFIHDILKQFFYRRMSLSQRKKHHLIAAKLHKNEEKSKSFIEAIYHYLQAGEYKKASQLAINKSTNILEGGYAKEFLTILDSINDEEIDTTDWLDILIITTKAYNAIGEWKKALQFLNKSNDIAIITNDKKQQAKVFCESGFILEEQNELEKALKYFTKSLNISKKGDFPLEMCRSYRGIGRVHWKKNEPKEAITNYKKSLEISRKSRDFDLIASIYTDLGNVYDERHEIKNAIEYYNKSIDILKKVNNPYETMRSYHNLAVTYAHIEEFHKAIDFYKKSLRVCEDLDSRKWISYEYASIGYCYAKIKDFKKAKDFAKKAEEITLKIDDNNVMININKIYAFVYLAEEKWDKALKYYQRAIDHLNKINAFHQLSDSYYELGQIYQEMGNEKIAKKHFNKATKLYNELGIKKKFTQED